MTYKSGMAVLRTRYSVGGKVYNSLGWAFRAWDKTRGVKIIKHSVMWYDGIPTECSIEVFMEAW